MLDVLRSQTGCQVARMEGDIEAVEAGELAASFGVSPTHPLLKLTQSSVTDTELPVMFSENYHRPDVVRFRFVRRPTGI
ncbi:UTRA domain-containing protein [Pseudonocardia alni]|uniref:UTRA domain-containing protein n=1 Tax=Pseudonocardia alni TaxID=33907 RepID=UPI00280AC8E3|nr:UTRA domain-containing protein [Pseudonocardia alni]